MIRFKRFPLVLRIEVILLVLILFFYFRIGSRVSALDNATRILGDPSEPAFKLTLIYLLIHFSLIMLLPVHIAVRLTGICWDRKLTSARKK
jgi:uncharacterized membrane protein